MKDLISRQAILKKIENIRQGVQMMDDTRRASIIMNGMHLCEEAVRNQPSAETDLSDYSDRLWQNAYERGKAEGARIPSAQPEIIRCKDCKHYKTDHPRANGYHCCYRMHNIFPMKPDDFCSHAERREDGTP